MLAHPGFGTCHMRRQNVLPAQLALLVARLLEKSVRRLRFRPILARSGNAGRRLVSKTVSRQLHQPLIQSFISQCRSGKLFHRPRLHHCLSIEKTTRKQWVDQIAAVNRKIGRKTHRVRLCDLSCVERYALKVRPKSRQR
jgi:hypothetical protein